MVSTEYISLEDFQQEETLWNELGVRSLSLQEDCSEQESKQIPV